MDNCKRKLLGFMKCSSERYRSMFQLNIRSIILCYVIWQVDFEVKGPLTFKLYEFVPYFLRKVLPRISQGVPYMTHVYIR